MIWSWRLSTAEGHTSSLFRVAVLLTTAGSMSKPTSEFTTYAPRTGETGHLTKHIAPVSGRGRRDVQPNQRLKLIIAFVTHPGVTNVVVLEKFRICRCAQYLTTFWAGARREIPFINAASGRSDPRGHKKTLVKSEWPSLCDCCASTFNVR